MRRLEHWILGVAFGLSMGAMIGHAQAPAGIFAPPTFVPVTAFGNSSFAGMVLGDFTNDGVVDAVVGTEDTNLITCLGIGGPSIVFGSGPISNVTPGLVSTKNPVATADFNLDGNLDVIVVAGIGPSTFAVQIYANDGTGTFIPGPPMTLTGNPNTNYIRSLDVADLDSDGGTDIATISSPSGLVEIRTVSAAGVVATTTLATAVNGGWSDRLAIGDVDGDALRDVVWAQSSPAQYTVFRRTSGGSGFVILGPYAYPFAVAPQFTMSAANLSDVNADGSLDLVIAGLTSTSLSGQSMMMVMNGPIVGGATGGSSYVTNESLWTAHRDIADFDLDGSPDLQLELQVARVFSAYSGRSTAFIDTPVVTPGSSHVASASGDFDTDGDLDVLIARVDNTGPIPFRYQLMLGICENLSRYRPGCPGTLGTLGVSIDRPAPGNLLFSFGVSNAVASAPAVLGLTLNGMTTPIGCGLWLDLSPNQVLSPQGSFGLTTTGQNGSASISVPIPALPQLVGFQFFMQWAVVDPAGGFQVGPATFALSEARHVMIW